MEENKSISAEQEQQFTEETIKAYIEETFPKDEKERPILPDDFFDEYIKILPNGCRNESKTKLSHFKGYLTPLGWNNNPEYEKRVRTAGAEATNAKLAERRTIAETLNIYLAKKDENGIQGIDRISASMIQAAEEGNVRAAEFIRDTVGEKPADKQELTANIMTEADRAVLSNVAKRLNGDIEDED